VTLLLSCLALLRAIRVILTLLLTSIWRLALLLPVGVLSLTLLLTSILSLTLLLTSILSLTLLLASVLTLSLLLASELALTLLLASELALTLLLASELALTLLLTLVALDACRRDRGGRGTAWVEGSEVDDLVVGDRLTARTRAGVASHAPAW
jgi:hypothetical protein